MVTAERYAKGMTFDEYVAYTASPENLARESSPGGAGRAGWSEHLRRVYEATRFTPAQQAAWAWLLARPDAPAKILAISEEWSSDCRRDIPVVARLAAAGGVELRIFPRDGRRFSAAPEPDAGESPNADLMTQFLNRRDGKTFQSIPVIVFFTRDMTELYRYIELPAVYHKDRVRGALRAARPGETPEQTRERGNRDFMALQESPFFDVWREAAVAEWLSMLHERARVGSLA